MTEKLTGGLKYCRMEECTNTVHREDAPSHYPCCDKHKEVNKAYWEIEAERRYYEQLNKELYA